MAAARSSLTQSAGDERHHPPPDVEHRRVVEDVQEGDLTMTLSQDHQHRVHQLNGLGEEVPPEDPRHLNIRAKFYQGVFFTPSTPDYVADNHDWWNRNPPGLPRFYLNLGPIFKTFHDCDDDHIDHEDDGRSAVDIGAPLTRISFGLLRDSSLYGAQPM